MDPACCSVPFADSMSGHLAGPSVWPLYLQVFSLGLVWTTLHCSGMCGPLLAGLGFGRRGSTLDAWRAAGDVLLYQLGRAVVYAAAGSLVGWLGSAVLAPFAGLSPWILLVTAVILLAVVLRRVLPKRPTAAQSPGVVASLAARATKRLASCPRLRAIVLGAILALLPCMLPAWVLGLAATSGSALHGALLMVSLVVLTVPVLLTAVVVPVVVGRWRRWSAPWIGRAALGCSATWLLVISLAGFGLVPHAHLDLGNYHVMFW
jgi:uncharacterized protein